MLTLTEGKLDINFNYYYVIKSVAVKASVLIDKDGHCIIIKKPILF